MKAKKCIAIIIAAVMLTVGTTSCSGVKKAQSNSAGTESTTEKTTAASESTTAAAKTDESKPAKKTSEKVSKSTSASSSAKRKKKVKNENLPAKSKYTTELYLTICDQKKIFAKQPDGSVAALKKNGSGAEKIVINDSKKYQSIIGFGASFTDSSAYLANEILPQNSRDELMEKLFDPESGIGLSFLRNTMGACDYSRKLYTYDDSKDGTPDLNLKNFSIDHDKSDIIPLTKTAISLNPQLKVMASPWSPPGWMRQLRNTLGKTGGKLEPEYYDSYAEYFVKYIKAYENEGIPIYAVTPQNEALYDPIKYPGMILTASEETDFINNHLGPKFEKNGIKTKILCYDHNWDNTSYASQVLSNAGKYVSGVAWHGYAGKVTAQTAVRSKFPDKEIYFTENSGGEWIPPFEKAFMTQINNGIIVLNNYSKTYVLWNIALDENNGPVLPFYMGSTCRGLVTINQKTKQVTYNLDYYALAHFSKFIRPNAVRIGSNSTASLKTTAFRNTDGSIAAVVSNDTDSEKTADINVKNKIYQIKMPAKSAATFVIR